MLDIARQLDWQRAARATHTEIGIGFRAIRHNPRDRRQRHHIVHNGWLAEQAFKRWQRRLGANNRALAFQALQKRGFFAADIGTGTQTHFKVEGVGRAANRRPQPARRACGADGFEQRLIGMRIFGAEIDKALGRANGHARNRHTFDEGVGVAFHQHPVGEGAAIAFVRVADNVFLIGFGA